MTIFQAIILGLVQGVTEFLPISSSGHLIIFPKVFNWPEQGFDFDVLMHLATLLAVVWIFRNDIFKIIKNIFKKNEQGSLGWKIALATVPIVIAGFLISGSYLDSIRTVKIAAINLILWGALLWAADWYSAYLKTKTSKVEKSTWLQAIAVGLSQIFSLIPGVSRSGVTISTGLFMGLDRVSAARFSFLLAIPATLGAGLMAGIDVAQNGISTPIPSLIAGFLAAFIAGLISVKFLLRFLIKSNYAWFAAYRIALGLILLFFVVT